MALTWRQHDTPARLRWVTECRTYVVAADKPTEGHMPWWIARHSSGREIAAGYGDPGLSKCQRFCRQDLEREQREEQPAQGLVIPPAADPVPTSRTSDAEVVRTVTVPTSPPSAQAALF